MKMMVKIFAKKLFGVKYEQLSKAFLINSIVFLGLHTAGYRLRIAPFILNLMVSTFSAGVMWRALASEDNAANLKNLFMLPFGARTFVFSYVSALGTYTLLTKTMGLLAVVLAVSPWSGTETLWHFSCAVVCAANAILVTACVYAWKKCRCVGVLWGGAVIAAVFLLGDTIYFLLMMAGNGLLSVLILAGTDAYAFYRQDSKGRHTVKGSSCHSVWRYLFRYLTAHKNYMMNTVVLWGAACVLPFFFRQIFAQDLAPIKGQFVMPVGFAILSVNTPLGILLSCAPALEQAVRFLPDQGKAFCVPYALFLFLCSMTADIIFLCSFQLQIGGVNAAAVLTAAFFALFSAVGSVLLEWFFPIRGWKIESDLWHHPRKYVVPIAMLLLAGVVENLC